MAHHPVQTLCCVQPVDGQQPFLLAASGPLIRSFNLKDGSLLSQWPRVGEADAGDTSTHQNNGNESRPTKRRRVEDGNEVETLRDNPDHLPERNSEDQKVVNSKLPNVVHILATSDGASVITLTWEDKSINVFSVRPGGSLDLESQRSALAGTHSYNLSDLHRLGPCQSG